MQTMEIKTGLEVFCLIIVLAIAQCGNNSTAPAEDNSTSTDYSQTIHWLSLPVPVRPVDVFYLYPTCWTKTADDQNICEIDNASMLAGAKASFARTATAFETVGNVYAPYYRQADARYTLSLPLSEREAVIEGAPTQDATAAFDFYIKQLNNGRPFILAGHSQGSNVLLNILAHYMKDNPAVYDRMIAAYVIGYSITKTYLSENTHLTFAQGPDDVKVIISFNTQSPDVNAGQNPVVLPDAIAINPITWTRDETIATKTEGLGSFMPVNGTLTKVPQYADARVDTAQGVVVTTADTTDIQMGIGPGIFHSYDYLFYYYNIRANAANRVGKYLEK